MASLNVDGTRFFRLFSSSSSSHREIKWRRSTSCCTFRISSVGQTMVLMDEVVNSSFRLLSSVSLGYCVVLLRQTDHFLTFVHHSNIARWFVIGCLSLSVFPDTFPLSVPAAVDGWAARRFNQVSKFGAWFDIIIDNIGRGILWSRVSSVAKESHCTKL